MTQARSTLEEKLRAVWIERNGTGTDACSTCRPPHICAWHEAMIDDIRDLIKSDVITNGELHYSHVCPADNVDCTKYHAREELRHRQRAIVDGRDNT